jgi:hypothetical protein
MTKAQDTSPAPNAAADSEGATVSDRSTEFVPVKGSEETSSAAGLLTAAYILMWGAVFAFIWLTSRRLGSMQVQVDELDAALKKADAASRRP